MKPSLTAALLLMLTVSGCATVGGRGDAVGIDGEACAGHLPEAMAGLVPADNPALLQQAQLASGKGGTCAAKVYSVQAPMVLYRVFDSSAPFSRLGKWWSAVRPTGTVEGYRAAFAICPQWSQLDRLVSCEVRPGTQVVIGTTQSVTCPDGSVFPKTAEPQVFVPNNGLDGIVHVGACKNEGTWP